MPSPALDRRQFLRLVGGTGLAALALPACGSDPAPTSAAPPLLLPGGATGVLRAEPVQVDLAGRVVQTWGYNGSVPGPEIRLKQGATVRALLDNRLPEETIVHWHGISLPNAMDGVPDVTQPPVAPGEQFRYAFAAPDSGSFMYHSHVGHQMDRGLYGPLIVDAKDEPGDYDSELTLMLDDWDDGLGEPAHDMAGHEEDAAPVALANPGPKMGGRSYPFTLVNAKPPEDPQQIPIRSGGRIRLRLMNIAADTGFLFAIEGHRLTVTHTDGMPVEPVTVSAIRLGMGERYDVVVQGDNPGAWQVAVVPEAKRGFGRAVLRYADTPSAPTPPVQARPAELEGRLLAYEDLHYAGDRILPDRPPDRVHELVLTTGAIGGQTYLTADPLEVAAGEWVRVTMPNVSVMWHPMHLHGHHFRVVTAGGRGPLKDTMLVPSGSTASFEFLASNAGTWMLHCHNHYHMDKGMARLFRYRG